MNSFHSLVPNHRPWFVVVVVAVVVVVVVGSPSLSPGTVTAFSTIPSHHHHHHTSCYYNSMIVDRTAGMHQRRAVLRNKNDRGSDEDTPSTVIPRPDPAILLSSQSDSVQQLGILAIATTLGLGTYGVIQGLTLLEQILPLGWYTTWRDVTWPVPFGLIFIAAGIAHFVMKDTFTAMVPPKNTWGGLWQVPAPFLEEISSLTTSRPLSYAEYHVYWSGLAEIGGGLLLIVSFIHPNWVPMSIPALLIFLLLCVVTPANIYMATHDVQAPDLPPIPYPSGHVGRGVLQCILLAMFWKLAFP